MHVSSAIKSLKINNFVTFFSKKLIKIPIISFILNFHVLGYFNLILIIIRENKKDCSQPQNCITSINLGYIV